MQMAEILENGGGGGDDGQEREDRAHSIQSLLNTAQGRSDKTGEMSALGSSTADDVEFWKKPEKEGWMQSQGDHIKTWRRRWFVLKDGFLFRFSSPDVGPSTKPRGIVDLSQVTNVEDGMECTGRENSIKVSTATGSKCYVTDSETSQVEWISALDGSVAKIVKKIAGVDDDVRPVSLAEQLQERYSEMASSKAVLNPRPSYLAVSEAPRRDDGGSGGTGDVVHIVNYQGGGGHSPHQSGPQRDPSMIEIDYGSIQGARTVDESMDFSHREPAAHSAPAAHYYAGGYQAQQLSRPERDRGQGYEYAPSSASAMGRQGESVGYSSAADMRYPSDDLMDAATAPPVSPPVSTWEVHYAENGRPYYYNRVTGVTTWQIQDTE